MKFSIASLLFAMVGVAVGWGMRDNLIPDYSPTESIKQCIDKDYADCGVMITFTHNNLDRLYISNESWWEQATGKPTYDPRFKECDVVNAVGGPGYVIVFTDDRAYNAFFTMKTENPWYDRTLAISLWQGNLGRMWLIEDDIAEAIERSKE